MVKDSEISRVAIDATIHQLLKDASIEITNNTLTEVKQVITRFLDGANVSITRNTMNTFSFGAIVNLLFVRFGHIGYGLALHYGWNFYRFNCVYWLEDRPLSEGMTFNYVEGNLWIAIGSLAACVLTLVAVSKNDGLELGGRRIAGRDSAQNQHAGH